jgi:sugar lactone lactonase YvrE
MKTNHLYAGWLALLVLLTSSLGGLAETLYVSAQYYGPGPRNDTIQKFTTNGFQSVYANFGSGGPSGLAVDKAGNLYVALENAGTIEKITREGVQTTFATNLSVPVGLALDAAGNLYVANLGINASYSSIEKFTPDGVRSTFATTGLNEPFFLAFDTSSNLYVSNAGNNTIEKFTPNGIGSVFASTGLTFPTGLAFDREGNLYVANEGNSYIEKFSPAGIGTLFANTGLNAPQGLAFDSEGNLYAANPSTSTIEKFTTNGVGSLFATINLTYPTDIAIWQPPAPNISSQPQSVTVKVGDGVIFSVTATSTTQLGYQWRFNTTNIFGATNSSYNIASATTNNSGIYAVVVSNAGGSVISSDAILTVIPPPRTGAGTAIVTNEFVIAVNITDGGSGYTNTPMVRLIGGGGSGAQAFATVSNGVVISITVTNAGYGYTNAPLVVIDPPFIMNPVLKITPYSFLIFSNLTIGGTYQLQQFLTWYWSNQSVIFTANNAIYTQMVAGVGGNYRLALNPVPAQAFASAQLFNQFVVGATVTSGGSGYVTKPTVNIVGGGGMGAGAYANISGGVVTSITVTNAGFGYATTPTIQIAAPPAASVPPTVFPVMRVDSANLAPYDNYQMQFEPLIGGTWQSWNGGLFTPTAVTNSQYLFITNGTGFFRLQYVP